MKTKRILSVLLAIMVLFLVTTTIYATQTDVSSYTLKSYKVANGPIYPKKQKIEIDFEIQIAKYIFQNEDKKLTEVYLSFDNSYFTIHSEKNENIPAFKQIYDGNDKFCGFSFDKEKSIISGSIYVDATKNIPYGQTDIIIMNLFDDLGHSAEFGIPVDVVEAPTEEPEEPEDVVSTLTPHLFITGYNISEEAISAGEDFKLTVNFKNTSKTEDIENVIMTYSLPAGMALAKASTNFYFPKVAKDSTASQTVTITSDGSLMDGLQNIGIAFSYEYKNESEVYTQGSDSETLSVKVGATAGEEQDDRFEISSIDLPDMVYLGQEEYITINLINKGSKALNNVSAKINSENISNNGYNEYLGQVAANSKGEIELVINPSTAGDIIGTITVSYEHEDGTVVETTRDFTVFCEDPNAWMDDPGMYDPGAFDEPIEEKKFPVWGYVLIGVGAVAVVVAAVVITKKVIKNKKEKALEEELDEDI